jgi:mannose-6-phosphate isomerase
MACSDNTIRAGLTPKFKDVNTLCSSLTYRMSDVAANIYPSTVVNQNVIAYSAPTPEFAVHRINVSIV